MALRIAIDVRRSRDFGIGTHIRGFIPALGAIDHENEYLLVSTKSEHPEFGKLPENFRFIVHSCSDNDPRDHFRLPQLLRSLKPDLTHIPLSRVPLLLPEPFVVTTHDLSSLLFTAQSGLAAMWHQFRFRRGLLRAKRIVAVSSATSRDLQDRLGIPASRIRLVYNAPDPVFFRTGGGEVEREHVLGRYQVNYPFLLYAGTIRPQKNVPRLIEAFAVLREQIAADGLFPDLRLLIIGDELSRHPEVRRAVIRSRVENFVRFLGFVPLETLRVFYRTAEAFVFPSLYEGFGLPPIEAMASGTPVVTSHTPALAEVVGDAAVLVNPENPFDIARGMREVLVDEQLRQTLRERGRVHAALFSWQRAARDVLATYREAVG